MYGQSTITASKNNILMHKKKAQGRLTRQEIVDAAIIVFYEKGVSGTTLEQIAEKAGVTRGAIYHHYKNKHDLLAQVLEEVLEPLIHRLEESLSDTLSPDLNRIRELFIRTLNFIITTPKFFRTLSIMMLKCEYTAEYQYLIDKQSAYHDAARRILIAWLARMQDGGTVFSKPPALIAEAILCYTSGFFTRALKHPGGLDVAEDLGDYMDILFYGIEENTPATKGRRT